MNKKDIIVVDSSDNLYANCKRVVARIRWSCKKSMSKNDSISAIRKELEYAENKHEWPGDLVHAVAVIVEEVGELMQVVLQHRYENVYNSDEEIQERYENIKKEAVQVGAMAVRFLNNFNYDMFFKNCKRDDENDKRN
jgi:NTP pyrophosphatase (non-canonical NTP hydrolase)